MTRLVQEIFCYEEESVAGPLAADLMTPDWLRFEPEKFRADFFRKKGRYKPKQHIEIVRSADSIGWLNLSTEPESFSVSGDGFGRYQEISWVLPEGRQLTEEQILYLTGLPGFNAGYVFDLDDVNWQSTREINYYEVEGRDHSHLPQIQTSSGRTVLDISGNPGRRTEFVGAWLIAAPRMWFGGKIFDYIPRNRLLSFPGANRIEELPSGVIYIELFEDLFAGALPENRAKQKAFRDWVWMDELEEMAPGLPRDKKDPTFSIETGSFPHGGVRRVTQWVGEDGRPTRSSRAVQKISVEYGEGGEVVWKETQRIEKTS